MNRLKSEDDVRSASWENPNVNVPKQSSEMKILCKDKTLCVNLVIMVVIWSFGSFAFFLVPYYLNTMKANIYYLSMATECGEFVASVICLFIERCMNLKKAAFGFLLLIACGSLGICFVGEQSGDIVDNLEVAGLILVTYMGVVAAFDIAYLINAQLFPTTVLATAYGICNIFGRTVTIGSPVAARISAPWPMVIMLCFALTCSVLTCFLRKPKL